MASYWNRITRITFLFYSIYLVESSVKIMTTLQKNDDVDCWSADPRRFFE